MNELLRVPVHTWHPKKTIECGQIFHWYQTEDEYVLVRGKERLHVRTRGEETIFLSDTRNPEGWLRFLGVNKPQDLTAYKKDRALAVPLAYADGLRLLLQDPFVTIISFILSANNHFSRIRMGTLTIAKTWGEPLAEGIYAFPTPEILAGVPVASFRECCSAGYRDRYIAETAAMIARGDWEPDLPFSMNTDEARRYLQRLPGVGPKVCDCILLFGYGKGDTFPVDVWMHRIMQTLYPDGPAAREAISKEAIARFGPDAGLIQQMLFYYAKEHKLGTAKKV